MVFETLGAESELRSIAVLRPGGVMVGIGGLPDEAFAQKEELSTPIAWLLKLATRKRRRAMAKAGVRFVYLFMRPDGADLEKLAAWVEEGKLRPVIHGVFPLAEVKAAFAALETGRARGKVVVQVRGTPA
jgi:NADPH:quinone reductase-like Zn-dependent oxidoreductase